MALKFKCRQCGEYIITKFLKVGEVAKCQNCGAENMIPGNALEKDQKTKNIIPTGAKPEMTEKTMGKIRPFGSVLILSIITLSIYFWVYLFKTLQEMKNAFTFHTHETNPDRVRPILIASLIVFILYVIISEAIGYPFADFAHPSKTTGFYAVLVIINVIDTVVSIAFLLFFVKLIELCQKKRRVVPSNKSFFWIVYTTGIVISFASIGITSLIHLNLVVYVVFLYLLTKEVNRIWEE